MECVFSTLAKYRYVTMHSVLLLDVGNSRIKWAYDSHNSWLHQGAVDVSDLAGLRMAFANLPEPQRILASNVAGTQAAAQIETICAVWACPVEFITAQPEQCGVRNCYVQPAELGSDRWASLIAAWNMVQTACLVVNCGTATTVDALSNDGDFLGGLILPGIEMMRNGLTSLPARLDAANGKWSKLPRCTADAIHSGAIQATVGAIQSQYEFLESHDAPCILSGGAANDIQTHLSLPLIHMDNLVLQGLKLIVLDTAT
jgi:type III pantothenate kinase